MSDGDSTSNSFAIANLQSRCNRGVSLQCISSSCGDRVAVTVHSTHPPLPFGVECTVNVIPLTLKEAAHHSIQAMRSFGPSLWIATNTFGEGLAPGGVSPFLNVNF